MKVNYVRKRLGLWGVRKTQLVLILEVREKKKEREKNWLEYDWLLLMRIFLCSHRNWLIGGGSNFWLYEVLIESGNLTDWEDIWAKVALALKVKLIFDVIIWVESLCSNWLYFTRVLGQDAGHSWNVWLRPCFSLGNFSSTINLTVRNFTLDIYVC